MKLTHAVRALFTSLIPVAVIAGATSTSYADGRPPASVKVVFRPGSNTDAIVGTTFGLLITNDDGASWRWLCESTLGIAGTYDPDYEMTSTGLMLATSYDGLLMSRDGCHWRLASGPLGMGATSAVSIGGDGTIYAALSDPVAGIKVFKSTNDGTSFSDTSATLPQADWWSDMAVAPSDSQIVYLTGFRLGGSSPRTRVLVRSVDGGQSWQELPTTAFVGTNYSDLYIAAVDPTEPNTVFVRMTLVGPTLEEALYRTTNGTAATPAWTKVLHVSDEIGGVVVRRNGDVLAVQPHMQILQRSTDGGATFKPVAGVSFQGACLAERPGDQTLFMCMKNVIGSGPTTQVGRSATGAANTWTSYLRFVDITGPLRCEAGTIQHDDCEANLWCGTKEFLGATSNEIDCTPGTKPPGKGCRNAGGATGFEAAIVLVLLILPLVLLLVRRRRRMHAESAR